jgi:hypothetical protein
MSQDTKGLAPTSSDLEALVQHAGFIFAGTVRQVGAATFAGVPAEGAAVVRVDAPLQAPMLLHAYLGRDITLDLHASDELGVGDEAVFFASGSVYGQSIALRELGHVPITGDLADIRRYVVEAGEKLTEDTLRRRLADAVAVVAGRVAQTAEVNRRDEREPASEHDPRWFEAVIAIDVALRGIGAEKSVLVLFAGSRHVAWRKAPKLHVGHAGVWILHEDTVEGLGRKALVLVDARDSWPREWLRRIQVLLGEMD